MITLTSENVPEIVASLTPNVKNLLACKAIAQVEREAADMRQRKILAADDYRDARSRPPSYGRPITEPEHAFLMSDEQSAKYFALCDQATREAGYVVPAGYCPALMAEHAEIQAGHRLIDAAARWFGIDSGAPGLHQYEDGQSMRDRYLDMLIGLVTRHPDFKPDTPRMARRRLAPRRSACPAVDAPERAAVRAGGTVIFDSGFPSDGRHGTTMRGIVCIGGRFYARTLAFLADTAAS